MPAGQVVGALDDLVPAGDMVERFVEEATSALTGAAALG
jgi:NAD(P)H-dependent flavin oxidoreductase YrpB (nitropropane dioxygenase family)